MSIGAGSPTGMTLVTFVILTYHLSLAKMKKGNTKDQNTSKHQLLNAIVQIILKELHVVFQKPQQFIIFNLQRVRSDHLQSLPEK